MTDYNFDRVAGQYDATRSLPPGVAEQICAWVLARLPQDPRIFEIGVGTGRIALPFIRAGVHYTGFDISEQMLAAARAKLDGDLRRADLVLADVTESVPLPQESQDAVIAVHILHLLDVTRALPLVRRALKPHGALVWGYQWHDDRSPRKRIREQFQVFAGQAGGKPKRDFRVPEARRLLAEWGAAETRHVVATWASPETPEAALDALRSRTLSHTWHLDEAVFQSAMAQTEAWTRTAYGDLSRPLNVEERFVVEWFQF